MAKRRPLTERARLRAAAEWAIKRLAAERRQDVFDYLSAWPEVGGDPSESQIDQERVFAGDTLVRVAERRKIAASQLEMAMRHPHAKELMDQVQVYADAALESGAGVVDMPTFATIDVPPVIPMFGLYSYLWHEYEVEQLPREVIGDVTRHTPTSVFVRNTRGLPGQPAAMHVVIGHPNPNALHGTPTQVMTSMRGNGVLEGAVWWADGETWYASDKPPYTGFMALVDYSFVAGPSIPPPLQSPAYASTITSTRRNLLKLWQRFIGGFGLQSFFILQTAEAQLANAGAPDMINRIAQAGPMGNPPWPKWQFI